MKSSTIAFLAGAVALCGSVYAAEEAESEPAGEWNWAMGEGISFNETPIVSAELSISWDSKYLSYGLVDNNDPIVTPGGWLTFFDWVTLGVSAIIDTTHYGTGAGYYNRRWFYQEVDPEISLGHSFSPDDFSWLPTTVEFSIGYMYESHPRSFKGEDGDPYDNPDTQFATFEISLPDLWFEPAFQYERDIMRDQGTYLNLSIGHTFALIDGDTEEDDPVLTFRPSIGQGWGDRRRVSGYLSNVHHPAYEEDEDGNLEATGDYEPLERNGLMDTCIKGEMTWNICSGIALSGYVAYYDYIFDRHLREGARVYEATGRYKESYNFVCGLALTATF